MPNILDTFYLVYLVGPNVIVPVAGAEYCSMAIWAN